MPSLFCSKCLQHFPLSRDNVKRLHMPQPCPGCKGHGKVKGRHPETGKVVVKDCELCAGEGQLTVQATCTQMTKDRTWCQTPRLVPKAEAEKLTFIDRPDPRDPRASLRRRGLTPRYVRKGGQWPGQS